MYKACSRCGKIHDVNKRCYVGKVYRGGEERKLRSSSKWTKKSIEIRERANYLCEVCIDKGIINYKDVEVHHIDKLRDHESGLLDNDNLICLCKMHHKEADEGKIDTAYLKALAHRREGNTPPPQKK